VDAASRPQSTERQRRFVRSRIELMRRGEQLAERKDPVVRRQLEEIREFYEFRRSGAGRDLGAVGAAPEGTHLTL
jgi:hypothetical protein